MASYKKIGDNVMARKPNDSCHWPAIVVDGATVLKRNQRHVVETSVNDEEKRWVQWTHSNTEFRGRSEVEQQPPEASLVDSGELRPFTELALLEEIDKLASQTTWSDRDKNRFLTLFDALSPPGSLEGPSAALPAGPGLVQDISLQLGRERDERSTTPLPLMMPPSYWEHSGRASFVYPFGPQEPRGTRESISLFLDDKARLVVGPLSENLVDWGLARVLEKTSPSEKSNVHLFRTALYAKLHDALRPEALSTENGPVLFASDAAWYKAVSRFAIGVDLFKKTWLALPVEEKKEWFLVIIWNPSALLDTNVRSRASVDECASKNFAKWSSKRCVVFILDPTGKPRPKLVANIETYLLMEAVKAGKIKRDLASLSPLVVRRYVKVPLQYNCLYSSLDIIRFFKNILESHAQKCALLMENLSDQFREFRPYRHGGTEHPGCRDLWQDFEVVADAWGKFNANKDPSTPPEDKSDYEPLVAADSLESQSTRVPTSGRKGKKRAATSEIDELEHAQVDVDVDSVETLAMAMRSLSPSHSAAPGLGAGHSVPGWSSTERSRALHNHDHQLHSTSRQPSAGPSRSAGATLLQSAPGDGDADFEKQLEADLAAHKAAVVARLEAELATRKAQIDDQLAARKAQAMAGFADIEESYNRALEEIDRATGRALRERKESPEAVAKRSATECEKAENDRAAKRQKLLGEFKSNPSA